MRRFSAPRWAYDMERRLVALINHTKEQIVSNLDDRIDAVQNAVNSVGEAIGAEIQQLRDALAAGTPVSDAQLQRLDDLAAQLQGDVTQLQSDDPAAPPA